MQPPIHPSVGEISAQLATRVGALAPLLLPQGYRAGPHWRCGSVAGEPGQSLAINLGGPHAGRWHDFATGERGDPLDLVAVVLFAGNLGRSIDWASQWLGKEAGAGTKA